VCNPQTGTCTYGNQPDGFLCTDNDPCTTDDQCNFGQCIGQPRNCLDGDACTVDTCSNVQGAFLCEHTDCVNVPNSACPAQCQPIFCGNGHVDAGESCDPPDNTPDPDHPGQPKCRANCTRCGDGRIDTTDGESCDDGNLVSGCDPKRPLTPLDPCTNQCEGPICKDPGKIRLTAGIDRVDLHGRIEPTIAGFQLDPATNDFVVQLTGASGQVIFRATVPAGALLSNSTATSYQYVDRLAPKNGGMAKLKVKAHLNGFRVTARAYGDLSGAQTDMSTHFFIGAQEWVVPTTWAQTGYGWKLISTAY